MISMGKASQSKYPTQFSGHLTADLDENLASLDGNTYKVWSCLNRLLDSRAVNAIGQYLGYTVRVSQANIAKRVNLSVRSVRRCIKKMEAAGIIQAERPIFGCNRYRLAGYVKAVESHPALRCPVAPSVAEMERFEQEDTAVPSRGQSCVPSEGQSCVPPNRPVLSDKSVVDLSPPTPSTDEKTAEQGVALRERDFADLFYEEAMGKPNAIIDRQKRKRINRQCKQFVSDMTSRVGVDHAQAVLIDAFRRVRGYDPYSFGIMSADYGERCIEAAISAHLNARTALNVATLAHTASDEGETCETRDEPETNAHKPKMNVSERIRYHLAATKYRDVDHAVSILQRKDNTLTRDEILSVLEAVDKERSAQVPLLRCLSPHAVIESVGQSLSECADVIGALSHLGGLRGAQAMGG